jgi:hypothetical protein
MLENGGEEAISYLGQLDEAEGTTWHCCGCGSFAFRVKGRPDASPGVHILAEYRIRDVDQPGSIFIFSDGLTLSGVEVVSHGEVATGLPSILDLRKFSDPDAVV